MKFFYKLFILILLLNFLNCTSFFYYPKKTEYMTPETLGLKKQEEFLKAKDGTKLHLWRIFPGENDEVKNAVILQFHGNGENMSSHFISLAWLVNEGYELYTYDYRGYGKSEGKPNPEDINNDSIQVIHHVLNYCKKNNKKLIIYGQSLGGAVVTRALGDVTDRDELVLVVLEGTFSSYRMATRTILKKQIIEPFPFLASYIVSNSYSPEEFIEKISPLPIVIIHETEDPIVPFDNGKEVFKLAKDPKQFWAVTGNGHIEWMNLGRSPNAKKFVQLLDQLILEGY